MTHHPPRRASRSRRLVAALGILAGAAGCTGWPARPSTADVATTSAAPVAPAPAEPAAAPPDGTVVNPADRSAPGREAELYTGTGARIGAAAAPPPAATPPAEGTVVLNFEDADIQEVAKVVLGDLLRRNYVVEPGVTGNVTMQSGAGYAKEQLLDLFETLLQVNDASLVSEPDGTLRIVPRATAARRALPPLIGRFSGRLPAGFRTLVVPVEYVAVAELRKVLEPLVPEGTLAYADERRNLVILAGNAEELTGMLETIRLFDVDWLAGMSVGLFPIDHTDIDVIIDELKVLVGAEDKADGASLVRFVPVERLNSILVVTPQPAYLERLRAWIERLDRSEGSEEQRLFVYRVQNGKAADLATVLTSIFGEAGSGSGIPPATVAPGLRRTELASPAAQASAAGGGDAGDAAGPLVAVPELPRFSAADTGEIRVIADEVNNALVILTRARIYRMVEAALRQLDVAPMQVLIEASIIEVTLGDELEYGVEWFFKNSGAGGDGKRGEGLLDLGARGLAPFVPGFSYAIVDGADDVRAMINALASESRVNVLSSPSLMVLGNQTATINVGDEVPVPTRQSVSNIDPNAPTVNEIQYRDTGVILDVTPRVNTGGLITMEVSQEVSDVAATTSSGIDAPTFQQRKIASTVAVQSGSTVVLGGLIRNRVSDSDAGLPLLKDIPVLGKAFGATSTEQRRTELLVLITPRAVGSNADSQQVTEEFRRKLQGLRDSP